MEILELNNAQLKTIEQCRMQTTFDTYELYGVFDGVTTPMSFWVSEISEDETEDDAFDDDVVYYEITVEQAFQMMIAQEKIQDTALILSVMGISREDFLAIN